MNRAERQEVAWSLEKLRAAEARLADAVQRAIPPQPRGGCYAR